MNSSDELLIQSAANIPPASQKLAQVFTEHAGQLEARLNTIIASGKEFHTYQNANMQDLLRSNHHNQIQFFASLLQQFNPVVLVKTLRWVFTTYQSHGIQIDYWKHFLPIWIKTLPDELSILTENEIQPLLELYNWVYHHVDDFAGEA